MIQRAIELNGDGANGAIATLRIRDHEIQSSYFLHLLASYSYAKNCLNLSAYTANDRTRPSNMRYRVPPSLMAYLKQQLIAP